jgi:glycerol-3-phosphate acyltransferase PlsX
VNIALDIMGGDEAPLAGIEGALEANGQLTENTHITLVGDESIILNHINNKLPGNFSICHAPEKVTVADRASRILKKKPDSSIVKGLKLVKQQKADAFISAGSTGAVMATALLLLGRIKGVRRPALGAYIPTNIGGKILCDVGANPEVKPIHLLQFAVMASYHLEHIEGIKNPKVGLVNIGVEPSKGNELYRETHKLLVENLPNFIGNVEGRHLLTSDARVLVCDGFVGNTVLKFAESWINIFSEEINDRIKEKLSFKLGASLMKPVFSSLKKQYDYEEHGGTPLLGVNGVCIIAHGSAGTKSIKNSIFVAKKCVEEKFVDNTQQSIGNFMAEKN